MSQHARPAAAARPRGRRRRATRRARSPGAKDSRRARLLAIAARLFASSEYDAVTVAAIAARARLAKGTLYRYFATKEALFLDLLTDALAEWLGVLTQGLVETADRDPAREVSRLIATTLTARPHLTRLLALLHTTLEQNVDPEGARRFKRRLVEVMAPPARALEARAPALAPGDGLRFLLRTHALVVGLAQAANPPPHLARALAEDPELSAFVIDFCAELEAVLAALLRGWR